MSPLGRLLRELSGRESQVAVARRVGLSKGYLSNLEAGRRRPAERRTRQLLKLGFGLRGYRLERELASLWLEERGVRDPELRAALAALILDPASSAFSRAVIRLHQGGRGRPTEAVR